MFFQGSLQEAISTALQESKSVVCFVTDGETESQRWESEFLTDESLRASLQDQAVTLRLQAGSTEAGYLAAIFPLPKTPTLVVIKNGQLREYIVPDVSKDDFVARTRKALAPTTGSSAQDQLSEETSSSSAAAAPAQTGNAVQATGNRSEDSSEQATPSAATAQRSSAVQSLLAERAARLEAQRKKEAEEAKLRRKAKAQAAAAGEGEKKVSNAQSKHMQALKQRQAAERAEKNRILQAIEDDRAARRARQSEKEAERKASLEAQDKAEGAEQSPWGPSSSLPSTTKPSDHSSLQFRLFDGSTMRNRFSSNDRLVDVRKWVDENCNVDRRPYTFKVVLTPLPNKNIDVAEEKSSLQALGLTPSSTLILVPVSKPAAVAYAEEGRNPISRFFMFIVALIAGIFSTIGAFFTTLFSTSGPSAQQPAESAGSEGQNGASGRDGGGNRNDRVNGLRSRVKDVNDLRSGREETRNDQQFYNGNSTNFEPRRDDEDDE